MALILTAGSLLAADNGAKYQPQLAPYFTAGETFTYRATAEFNGLARITDSAKKTPKDATGKTIKDADGKVRMVRTDNVRRSEQTHFSAELSADTALARSVFKNGTLHEAEYLIRHCELIDDKGNSVELLPAGTIVGARKQADGQVAFAINGKVPSPELAARLSVLIIMGDEQSTANELLGAPEPVPVGATWPVNEKAMLKSDLSRMFPGVDRLAGSVVLRAAQADQNGTVHTTTTSTYRLGDVHPPFPDDVIANPSNVRFEIAVTAPVTPGPGEYNLKTSALIRHAGHTGDIQVGMSETDMEVGFTIDQEAHYVIGGAATPNAALAAAPPVKEMPPLAPGMSSAPVFRPPGAVFRPGQAVANQPVPTAEAVPTNAKSAPPTQAVPADSPFSKAQDLPGQSAK
jgi:hypothetical protein